MTKVIYHFTFLQSSLMAGLEKGCWILISASEFTLQYVLLMFQKKLWPHPAVSLEKGEYFNCFASANFEFSSLIKHQILTSGNFLKATCSGETEAILVNLLLHYPEIHWLVLFLSESFTHA